MSRAERDEARPADASAHAAVLVYSDDRGVRERVRTALGRRVAADLPPNAYLECATEPAVIGALDRHAGGDGRIDLLILDGEAAPAGGMGLCRRLKDEIPGCPPVIVLIARPPDAWLAQWSGADAAVTRPADPAVLAEAAARLLRAPTLAA